VHSTEHCCPSDQWADQASSRVRCHDGYRYLAQSLLPPLPSCWHLAQLTRQTQRVTLAKCQETNFSNELMQRAQMVALVSLEETRGMVSPSVSSALTQRARMAAQIAPDGHLKSL
jgi:hypothetical protein